MYLLSLNPQREQTKTIKLKKIKELASDKHRAMPYIEVETECRAR